MPSHTDFLHIPDGETVSMILKYNTGLPRNGQFGKYFIYTVMHDGNEKLLKVTERLEKQFRKNNVQAEQSIQLRKDVVTPDQGEPYSVVNLVREQNITAPDEPSSLLPEREGKGEMQLLQQSLLDAQRICQSSEEATTTVIVAVGLFLSRTLRPLLEQSVQSKRRTFPRRTKPGNTKDKACPPSSTFGRGPAGNISKKEADLPF